MEKLYKIYYDEICSEISKELGIPIVKVKRALNLTYKYYRFLMGSRSFDSAIKLINIGKFIPTILSKKMRGIVPKKNTYKDERKDYNCNDTDEHTSS